MAGRNYERLPIEKFGRLLLHTNDLDPIYIALCGILRSKKQPVDWVKRWLVAYWCLYSAGSACFIASQKDAKGHDERAFWHYLMMAAANVIPTPFKERWPRGHERRHFRGKAAIKAVEDLQARYKKPEEFVDYVMGKGGHFTEIAARVQEHTLFGPWISFKVADMAERVLKIPVDFSESAVFMFTDPTKAALMLWRKKYGLPEEARPKDKETHNQIISRVVEFLLKEFHGFQAPPDNHRPLGLQEIETILCKWKSHMNGHYPPYNDIDEIRAGLEPWCAVLPEAKLFTKHMPARPSNET